MAALIGLFVGAFLGNLLWHDWGAALGGIAGFLVGAKLSARRPLVPSRLPDPATGAPATPSAGRSDAALRTEPAAETVERTVLRRIDELERRVAQLEGSVDAERDTASAALAPTAAGAPVLPVTTPSAAITEARGVGTTDARDAAHAAAPSAAPAIAAPAAAYPSGAAEGHDGDARAGLVPDRGVADRPVPPAGRARVAATPVPPPARTNPLWAWFTGGNALTRIGVVVLFFGVAFLLKYFAEHFTLPIEWRLAAVAAGGLALTGLGLRLAPARPGYGLSLQGAGAGVLYLTTYAAFGYYGVLSEPAAIALLVAVSAMTVFLAARGDSQPLAGLAIAGGFLAPMLVATDLDPVLLFGYFALLNAAILALAWKKAWRALNAVGFVFTFVLGVAWGHEYYRPEHYATVQPFLALFFLFYLAIAILYARRGPLAARDPVDGLLVFGVPLMGFVLQAALVRDSRYGAAWSALALAGVYALLFVGLRKRTEPGFPLLSRAFLALAAIFVTIAIPFALDNRETAALWAVEAAGVYWLGVRQGARIARVFALLVEIGAGALFIAARVAGTDDPLFANAYFIGALLIALSGLATALVADRAGDALPAGERSFVPLLLGWGIVWWLAAGGTELVRQLPRAEEAHAVLAWVTGSVALALALARWLRWPRLAGSSVALLPAMALAALGDFHVARTTLGVYGWLVWPCAWVVHWWALRVADGWRTAKTTGARAAIDTAGLLPAVHAVSATALVAQLSWEASEWTGRWTAFHTAWTPCAAALPAIAFLWLAVRFRDSTRWPLGEYRHAYASGAGLPIAGILAVWFVLVNVLSPGDSSPLPYVPLANPLDLTLALALSALAAWAGRFAGISERALYRWIGAGLFVALNGIVLRAAHHWGDIPWRLSSLLASKPLQAALTLAWTVTALATMFVATKRGVRPLWMLGAGLLALVVGKLFLVDLGALSGLPRVVAFLGVGVLLLLIGYLSPLPPAPREAAAAGDASPRS